MIIKNYKSNKFHFTLIGKIATKRFREIEQICNDISNITTINHKLKIILLNTGKIHTINNKLALGLYNNEREIYVCCKKPISNIIYTICHEFCHYIQHRNKKKITERNMNKITEKLIIKLLKYRTEINKRDL